MHRVRRAEEETSILDYGALFWAAAILLIILLLLIVFVCYKKFKKKKVDSTDSETESDAESIDTLKSSINSDPEEASEHGTLKSEHTSAMSTVQEAPKARQQQSVMDSIMEEEAPKRSVHGRTLTPAQNKSMQYQKSMQKPDSPITKSDIKRTLTPQDEGRIQEEELPSVSTVVVKC